MPHPLIKKETDKSLQHIVKEKKNEKILHHGHYSPGIRRPTFFAPVVIQSLASLFMLINRMLGGLNLLRKILAFLSFHIVQLTSIVREAIAFLCTLVALDILVHQSLIDRSPGQVVISMVSNCSHTFSISESLNVYRHL